MRTIRTILSRRHRVVAVAGLCLLMSVASVSGASALAGGAAGTSKIGQARNHQSRLSPVVEHTGRAPTGYQVTFRYYAPTATRVQIKGEWYFERPSDLPQQQTTPTYTVQTPGLLPSQWQPGDIPASHPNSTSPLWPVIDMRQVGHSGIWTYTTPLPSGVFSYGFFVNCSDPTQATCTELTDPSNPAWTTQDTPIASVTTSQVYVPSDKKFDTVDYTWQGPAPVNERGTLRYVTYSDQGHLTPLNSNAFVVYTPPGYDPNRAKPYPTFYLSHGGGENEMGWTTQGDMQNIMDNLVDVGAIQPMVVVMPNATGYASSPNNQLYRTDLIQNVIPWVEQHYNVSTSAADRAYAGLSAGGMRTTYLMLFNTAEFGYYGQMSAGLPPGTVLSAQQIADLKNVSIFVGAGWQDPIDAGFSTVHRGPFRAVRDLTNAGVHVQTDFINGGHEWHVWRILLKDFLTRVAFQPPTTAPASWGP